MTEKKLKDTNGKDSNSEKVLKLLEKMQEENDERFGEIETQLSKGRDGGADKIELMKLFYETDDKHILELSNISPASVRPFATALTLGSILKPQVQSGKVSLAEIQIINYLRLRRSAYGKHFGLGVKALEEQAAAVGQQEVEGRDLG